MERRESDKRDYLQIEHQSMIIRKNWVAFFHNIENKKDLCNLLANFIRKSCFRDSSHVSVAVSNNVESWFVTDQYVEQVFESNHEKADTRMNLHTLYKKINAVIVFKNTCVLMLLVCMYTLENITSKSCIKIDNETH